MTPEFKTTATKKVRVRYDINSPVMEAQRNVEYYKKAVAKMKALSQSNPQSRLGWVAQAEIHRKHCGADPMIPNIHRTSLFLPWHRAYLFFFEEICRQLLMEDNIVDYDDFALPYWDWTNSPQMPDAFGTTVWDADLNSFKTPPGWSKDPNFTGERGIKPRGYILGDVRVAHILNANSIYQIIGEDSMGPINAPIETGPHGIIHNEIGGNMKEPDFAALDPIFWLHHANIDRLWSEWMGRHPGITPSPNCEPEGCGIGCKYPTVITKWLKKTVREFYDVSGTSTSQQVLNLLDTFNLKYLGYCYADCKPIAWSDCPQIQTLYLPDYSIKSKVLGETVRVNEPKKVEVRERVDLTSENLKILKNLDAAVIEIIQNQRTSDSSSTSPSLFLSLEVEKPENPAISVRVFIHASSDKSDLSIESPSYVATFSFFESTNGAHHHDSDNMNMNLESRGFIFDITNTIIELSKLNNSKPFTLEDATISIFPKLLNDESSDETENIKLIRFRFDLAK